MSTIQLASAIIHRDDKVLAAHRADGALEDGWRFPNGKVCRGETPEHSLRLAVADELGCRLQIVQPYDRVEHDYPDFRLVVDAFVCTLAPGEEPRALAYDEVRWVGRDELLDLAWREADRKLMTSLGTFWDDVFETQHL